MWPPYSGGWRSLVAWTWPDGALEPRMELAFTSWSQADLLSTQCQPPAPIQRPHVQVSLLTTARSSVPAGKSYHCVLDLRLKEDSLHSPLHTWASSMKWGIKGPVITNWAKHVFGFSRGLGEGLNRRHKLKPEHWSREAKEQLIGSNRAVSLRVCGGFMHHPGQGCGGTGCDNGGEWRKSGIGVEFGGLVEDAVNPHLRIEWVGMRRDRTGIRHSVPVWVGSPGSLSAETAPLPRGCKPLPWQRCTQETQCDCAIPYLGTPRGGHVT